MPGRMLREGLKRKARKGAKAEPKRMRTWSAPQYCGEPDPAFAEASAGFARCNRSKRGGTPKTIEK